MPSLATLKLIGYGIGALALTGFLAFVGLTLKSWHDASVALPVVTAERDTAIAQKSALDKDVTGKFDGIAARLDKIDKDRAATDAKISANQTDIDAAVQSFERTIPHAVSTDPARDDLIRSGLRQLIAISFTGSKPGADGSGNQSGQGARLPAASTAH
ncbi:MAG: hypothetical protein WCA78_00605 [Rhizomicrobium sp.]